MFQALSEENRVLGWNSFCISDKEHTEDGVNRSVYYPPMATEEIAVLVCNILCTSHDVSPPRPTAHRIQISQDFCAKSESIAHN